MAQQDRNLPEGTDSIIPGAMDTDTSDVTATSGKRGGSRSSPARRGSSSSGGDTGLGVMERIRSGSDKITEQAGGKAREFVGQGLERSAEALSNIGKLVGETASGLDERLGEEYGDYARRAAEALDNTASKLAAKNPDELIDDTRTFVRKSPGVALAGAAIVGFALARLIKSGLSGESDEDEDDEDGRGSRRRS